LIVIGWLVWGGSFAAPAAQSPSPTPVDTSVASTSQTMTDPAKAAGLSTATTDNTDAALQSDMSSVDTQMTGLNSDTQNVDQSVNNPPVSPTTGL